MEGLVFKPSRDDLSVCCRGSNDSMFARTGRTRPPDLDFVKLADSIHHWRRHIDHGDHVALMDLDAN
jgi:hypothetical protein